MNPLRGCALYFDCFAGIAGDMALGALLDLGVPEEVVRDELARLEIGGWRLERERVMRGALAGTKIHVRLDGEAAPAKISGDAHAHHHGDHHHAPGQEQHAHAPHPHRHYREIRALLEGTLSADVGTRALAIFDRLAAVEARLHGVAVDEVAFHEVGAVDSIVDIVGTAAALAWLAPSRITARRVPLGGGSVETAHGRLPVPTPATLELLAGCEVEAGTDRDGELTTPTGAAILAASASSYGPLPACTLVAVGWGAGDRQLADRPNLLRVVAGRPALGTGDGPLVVVEANIDDMNPELCQPVLDELFAAGAVDAWFQPIVMKKGRPALMVGALCEPADREAVIRALLRESTTIGVRFHLADRTVLPRRLVEVDTPYGAIAIKLAADGDDLYNAAPEYEACRRAARAHDVPVKRVYLAALAAFYRR